MAYEYDTPEDLSTGSQIAMPGTYHVIVGHFDEHPQSKAGRVLDAWKITLKCLEGTEKSQVGKDFDLMLFAPDMSAKDGGKFAKLKQARFLRAVALISDNDRGKRVAIELENAIGRQLFVVLEPDRDEPRYMRLRGADLFHVDDPEVKDVPRDVAMLQKIPTKLRAVGAQKPPEAARNAPANKPKTPANGFTEAASVAQAATASLGSTVDEI